jgi:hypothetical protein
MIQHLRIRVGEMLPERSLVVGERILAELAQGEDLGAHHVEQTKVTRSAAIPNIEKPCVHFGPNVLSSSSS